MVYVVVLPEPSRPAAVSLPVWSLLPEMSKNYSSYGLQQLEQVTDIPASQLPAAGNNVPVKYRLMDLMQNGTQYMAIIGGIPMTVPVVDAVPVPDRSRPGTNIKDVYSAPVSPSTGHSIKCGSDEYSVLSNPEIQEEGLLLRQVIMLRLVIRCHVIMMSLFVFLMAVVFLRYIFQL